ncbi:hypothetical protein [Streptomyces sp. CC53]|uniref:hypothetical protein n=1 Tax=Streptomyces sp. CC53 TaxID=1906740 RepID=UPI0009A12DFD|nr:hypothetical protein [Streptomyces sp. CC53]
MSVEAEAPARRRRHARLIATLAELVGECASAALGVYGPIAYAPPRAGGVPVNVGGISGLALSAAERLDRAVAQDAARWPAEVSREDAHARDTFHRRCAAAEADQVVIDAQFGGGSFSGEGTVPTPPQAAAMDLAEAGGEFLDALDPDPADALAFILGLTASGEYSARGVLDEATRTAVLRACLVLREAAREEDPSMAAERCLTASRHLALAVSAASIDLDDGAEL